ncbi:hypothetical protein FKG94_12230 [Exilibacterium tricleocarpae]|uniref:Porin n=1 Tax=Exilibacterium tricleocarpae TaxID=2591008 RepID=A0A545TNI4_9GAMM|nr:hypothetical protein [Exilibacterium tricleocarpae]TQV78782.1 hypothetical protein FKG94_12230 [Exilibacterium tricleocarpae]
MNSNLQHLASYKTAILAAIVLLPFGRVVLAGAPTFTPNIGVELRYFPDSPAFDGQLEHVQPSVAFGVEGRWVSDDRKKRVRFEPFLRVDAQDSERTHFDLRELTYSQRLSDFDLLVGSAQVFWGVAESRNVVDIINQFDGVENNDETDKLGQPLVRLGKFTDVGRFEAYYLPYFRERTFPGKDGRQRGPLVVDTDAAEFERGGEEFAGDFALRYQHQIDKFDIGAHIFYGTNRSPFFKLNGDGSRLIPVYQELTQGGVDLQWTSDAWLLKFEGIAAHSGGETYISSVAGFEYTFFDVKESGIDVGILAEGLYDNRDETQTALTLFENDVFLGTRITWNDVQESELLAGAVVDWESGATFGSIEFETRIGENMKFEVEAQILSSPDSEPLAQQERDSNITVRLTRYF